MNGMTLLEQELMLQVNQHLFEEKKITTEMYEKAKDQILKKK